MCDSRPIDLHGLPLRRVIDVRAHLIRLWNSQGAPIALVQFALDTKDWRRPPLEDVGSGPIPVAVNFRQMDSLGGRLRDSSWSQGFNASAEDPAHRFANGYVAVPLNEEIRSWNLMVSTQWWHESFGGPCVQTELLPVRGIVVSDLALGVAGSDLRWELMGRTVLLSSTGEFSRKQPIHVTYQVRSDTRYDGGRTTITLTNVSDPARGERLMQVRFDGVIAEGVNFVERELDVSHLKPGKYLVELEVADKHGGGSFGRSGMFTLN